MILAYPIKEYGEPFQSMATVGGTQPFKPITTQAFGENANGFYALLGMKGHNGIDYVAPRRTKIYAAHDGKVTKTYDVDNSSRTIGFGVWITHLEGWTTAYFHLDEVVAKLDTEVKTGDLIGYADNTGEYTTGDHLHFGLYPVNMDKTNGYNGAIDPLPYIKQLIKTMYPLIKRQNDEDVYFLKDNQRFQIGDYNTYQFYKGILWDTEPVIKTDAEFALIPKGGVMIITKSI